MYEKTLFAKNFFRLSSVVFINTIYYEIKVKINRKEKKQISKRQQPAR